jgi:hypothetical protein
MEGLEKSEGTCFPVFALLTKVFVGCRGGVTACWRSVQRARPLVWLVIRWLGE